MRHMISAVFLALVASLSAALGGTPTEPTVVRDDGGWCWYQDERAVFVGDDLLVGSLSRAGDVDLSILDLSTMASSEFPLHAALQADDHDVPSFLHRADGHIMAFYSKHGTDTFMRYRVSTNPNDPTVWDPELIITNSPGNVTYSNPFQLSGEGGKIYLFYRGIDVDPTYVTSTNNGATWSAPAKLIDAPGERPYVKYCSDGSNTIHFVFTEGHPDEVDSTSVYHMVYRGGGLYQSDSTFITNLVDGPVTAAQATRVYDGTNATGEAWTWDVHLDAAGNPVVPYATFASRAPDDHRYRYARWDGAQWQDHEVARAGTRLYTSQASYSGGICVDPEDVDVVYISSDVDITNGTPNASGRYELYRGETANGGATWDWRALTWNSVEDNLRPIVPIGHTNETTVLWLHGSYPSYTSYELDVLGLFGSNVVAGSLALPAWTGYSIDLNDADAPVTRDGWTGLNCDHGTGAGSVTLHGIKFETFSAIGSRFRGSVAVPNPNALVGDFAFDDGNNAAVGLLFGGAGDLPAGEWLVDVYAQDTDSPPGNMIVGYRIDAVDTIVTTDVVRADGPAITFPLTSDGVSAYDVFVRENSGNNRSRLNAVRLRKRIDAPCAYSEAVLDQGPLELYRLDSMEGELGDALDVNGVDFHRATPDPALGAEGEPPYAGFGASNSWANFDGTESSALTDIATNWNSDAGSASFWVRMDDDGADGTQTGLFGRQAGGGDRFGTAMTSNAIGIFMRLNGSFGITIDNSQRETAAGRMTLNEWHHLAYTWERNTGAADGVVRMYIDGIEEAGYTNVSWSSFTIDEARFGKEIFANSIRKFSGSADELAIWTRTLTQSEVITQYWRSMKPNAVVAFAEGFQGYLTTFAGAGTPLDGQGGWSGSNTGVRRDLQNWSRMGGEWAYGTSGQNIIQKTIGTFAGQEGEVILEFCGRAGKKSLFSLGVADGGHQEAVYFGVEGANLRLMPTDGAGTRHNTTAPYTSAETQLMRMRLVIDLGSGTGSMLYYDGSDWQAPAALQGLDMYLRSGRAANNPENWNAVEINGQNSGAWDNLAIVYVPLTAPPPPKGGTLLIIK
jgi:hypothetical protein